jgi:hypothetical protein
LAKILNLRGIVMSFFFDVWSYEGFVLASDVSLIVNETKVYERKIEHSAINSKVSCAIVVCGEYPQACINYFIEACSRKDTLKEISREFATKWTKRYGGTKEYSAVHLVGFERIPGSAQLVPQVWYWHNWTPEKGFLTENILQKDLSTFSHSIPNNNHMPWFIKRETGQFPEPTLEKERSLVLSYLEENEPIFTWNGATNFWRSAGDAVISAMKLLRSEKTKWTIAESGELANFCLEFLAKVGSMLPNANVYLSPEGKPYSLMVTPKTIKWLPGSAKLSS